MRNRKHTHREAAELLPIVVVCYCVTLMVIMLAVNYLDISGSMSHIMDQCIFVAAKARPGNSR